MSRLTGPGRVLLRHVAARVITRANAVGGLGSIHVRAGLGVNGMTEYSIRSAGSRGTAQFNPRPRSKFAFTSPGGMARREISQWRG
jgi:hypothetical protein